jgi:ribonuclease P protein subunit RPR2
MEEEKGSLTRRIAGERIGILFRLATENYPKRPELADRYSHLIREIAMHYRIKLQKDVSAHICRGCGAFIVPGSSASVRVIAKQRMRILRCSRCGREKKVHY